jgi:hypothetical protein
VLTAVTRGISDDSNHFEVDGTSIRFRITRWVKPGRSTHPPDGTPRRLACYFSLGEHESGLTARVDDWPSYLVELGVRSGVVDGDGGGEDPVGRHHAFLAVQGEGAGEPGVG